MVCPRCGNENKSTNICCEFCGEQLIDEKELDTYALAKEKLSSFERKEINISTKKVSCLGNVLIFFFLGPVLLIGIVFFFTGLIFSFSEHRQTKGYEKTEGVLKEYTNCTYEDKKELCEAVYEYRVNGVSYTVSPRTLSGRDHFDKEITVYYNPKDPKESMVYASWLFLTITGFFMVVFVLIFFAFKNKKVKRLSQGKEHITMHIYRKKK